MHSSVLNPTPSLDTAEIDADEAPSTARSGTPGKVHTGPSCALHHSCLRDVRNVSSGEELEK